MQRVRRLASIAVIAVIGATALTGCRSDPGVAAYLGEDRITEDRITAIIDELRENLADQASEEGPTQEQVAALPGRSTVLSTLVISGLCERLSADEGYQPQNQVTAEQIAPQMGLPVDSAYAQEQARLYTCISGVPSGAPVAPTEEELAEIVERGRSAGVIPASMSEFEARQRLDGDQLRGALGTRAVLAEAVETYDVTVNPRYRPLEFPVLAFQGNIAAVSVALGEGDPGTVVDAH